MSAQVSAERIEEVFWRACDAFRGRRSSEAPFLLSLCLFMLKFFSDLARDKREFPLLDWRGQALWASLEIPSTCDWSELESPLGRPLILSVKTMLHDIGVRNREVLGDVFEPFFVERDDEVEDNSIHAAVAIFSRLDLRPSSLSGVVLGTVYETLVEKFAESQGSLGEFYVPKEVSSLVARLADPRQGESIYDPYCRSGQLLARLAEHSKHPARLIGQAGNLRDSSLAKINMLLHGWGASRIMVADPIASPLVESKGVLSKFNVIVSNPPFGVDSWSSEVAWTDPHQRFKRGLPPPKMADYAFISHIVESMQEEIGRSVVVVSHGALFRGGSEASIRKAFVEENLVHGIIALPSGLFSATRIPVALMVFMSKREDRRVLFVDASHSYLATAGRNFLRGQDVERIVRIFETFETEEEFSYLASPEEIQENGFNLNVSRYVRHKSVAHRRLSEVWPETQSIQEELKEVQGELDALLRKLGVIPN